MKIFIDRPVLSHYFSAFVSANDELHYGPEKAFEGQSNGLLGVGIAETVRLRFGLHTGDVHFQLGLAAYAPPVDFEWEEVVEASWSLSGTEGVMFEEGMPMERGQRVPLGPGTYRLRYSAKNFGVQENWIADGNRWQDLPDEGECWEHYQLLIWPAPWAPDVILKATRPSAKSWHSRQQALNERVKEQQGKSE
jgi:hypothetical protein